MLTADWAPAGKHLAIVKDATKLLQRLEEEIRVTKLLEEAIAKRDYSLLMGGTNTAKDMKFTSPVVQKAEALMKLIEEERAAVKTLQTAIETRQLDSLESAMDKIKKLGLTSVPEWAQAEALQVSRQKRGSNQVVSRPVSNKRWPPPWLSIKQPKHGTFRSSRTRWPR